MQELSDNLSRRDFLKSGTQKFCSLLVKTIIARNSWVLHCLISSVAWSKAPASRLAVVIKVKRSRLEHPFSIHIQKNEIHNPSAPLPLIPPQTLHRTSEISPDCFCTSFEDSSPIAEEGHTFLSYPSSYDAGALGRLANYFWP